MLGIILGAALTVGGAYLYDTHQRTAALGVSETAGRPLVNWDVVAVKLNHLTARAREEWKRLASSS